jgi:hypothetical protein
MSKNIGAKEPDKYQDWCVQNAVDTLMAAEEIRQDHKMMKLVEKELTKRKAALNKLGGEISRTKKPSEILYKGEENASKSR